MIYDLGRQEIPNCKEIPKNTTENITVVNPYNVKTSNDKVLRNLQAKEEKVYIMIYKKVDNEEESLELDIDKAIIEDKNKKEEKPDDGGNKKKDEKENKSPGARIAFTVIIIIIIIFVLLLLIIYIRKKQLRNKELKYKQLLNKERELLSTEGNTYNPLMGGIISLED